MLPKDTEEMNPFANIDLDLTDEDGEDDMANDNADDDGEDENFSDDEDGDDEDVVKLPKSKYETMKKNLSESSKEGQILKRKDKIWANPQEFLKLYESNKEMAAEVAKRFGDKRSPSEIVKALKGQNGTKDGQGLSEDDLLAKVEHKQAMKSFNRMVADLEIDPDSKKGKVFMEEFEELTDGKLLDDDSMRKYFSKALKLANIPYEEGKRKTDRSYDAGYSNIGRAAKGEKVEQGTGGNFFDNFGKEGTKDWYADPKKK